MSRRYSRGLFWFGILACTLPMAGAMLAVGPPTEFPDVQGAWDGFHLAEDGATGPVVADVVDQDFRRLAGAGTLYDMKKGDVAYKMRATMPRRDFMTGTGETSSGRLTFKAGLKTFKSFKGDAGVMSAEYRLVPSKGESSDVSALLLHPFPGVATPDISGSGEGTFVGLPDPERPGEAPDPAFTGVGRVQIAPRDDRGGFAGRIEFFRQPGLPALFSWPLRATASDDGRVVMVSQGATGRGVYDGAVLPAPTAESDALVTGFVRLQFFDGQSVYGAINFNVSRR
jgi:hypothetical protein